MKKGFLTFLLVITLIIQGISACSPKKQKQATPPVPVLTAEAVKKTLPVSINTIGTVEASKTVSVKSQITVLITKVYFIEGQDVRKGDKLIEMDCRQQEAQFREAEANLLKDKANAEYAKLEYARYAKLIEKNYVAKQEYEQAKRNLAAMQATVKADEALIESSRVMMQYCTIYSPVSGRTGALKVNEGNVVRANETEIVTINQVEPVNVSISIPEKDIPKIKKYMSAGKLAMTAVIQGDNAPEYGSLDFIDNAVDRNTGTVTIKGAFSNSKKRLIPGQFVDVVLKLFDETDVIVIPSQGVEQGQSGQYVYVVKPDSTVELRPVQTGHTSGNETVIINGILAGEMVVTDGQLRLKPGSKVTLKDSRNKVSSK
jgi:membrane fusion protein, multidrug efflux system